MVCTRASLRRSTPSWLRRAAGQPVSPGARALSAGSAREGWQTVVRAAGATPRGSRSERIVKAVRYSRFGGPEVLEIVDLPDPHPGPRQVRVAVHAAGVNPTDWKLRKGLMGGELPQTTG